MAERVLSCEGRVSKLRCGKIYLILHLQSCAQSAVYLLHPFLISPKLHLRFLPLSSSLQNSTCVSFLFPLPVYGTIRLQRAAYGRRSRSVCSYRQSRYKTRNTRCARSVTSSMARRYENQQHSKASGVIPYGNKFGLENNVTVYSLFESAPPLS